MYGILHEYESGGQTYHRVQVAEAGGESRKYITLLMTKGELDRIRKRSEKTHLQEFVVSPPVEPSGFFRQWLIKVLTMS